MSVDRFNMQGKAKVAKDKEACHFDAVIADRCLFCLSPHQLLQWDVQGMRRHLLSRRHIMRTL